MVCLATASPMKFSEALAKAGVTPDPELNSKHLELIKMLLERPTQFEWMKRGGDWTAILRAKIESISTTRSTQIS